MGRYKSDIEATDKWVADVKAALREKSQNQKDLARTLHVNASTITRMLQQKPVRTGLIYEASVQLGIQVPSTLPLDPLQQRLLTALLKARKSISEEAAEALVVRFELLVDRVNNAVFGSKLIDYIKASQDISGSDTQTVKAKQDAIERSKIQLDDSRLEKVLGEQAILQEHVKLVTDESK